jgi:hypothetical protein
VRGSFSGLFKVRCNEPAPSGASSHLQNAASFTSCVSVTLFGIVLVLVWGVG